ncbi:MAG: hypothetical protein AAB225_07975, partial [Acidobacteriota bacterium]
MGTCLLLAFQSGPLSAHDGSDAASAMDQALRTWVDNRQFMGSVLVARDGQVLFSKGYGFADLEWQIPNTPA